MGMFFYVLIGIVVAAIFFITLKYEARGGGISQEDQVTGMFIIIGASAMWPLSLIILGGVGILLGVTWCFHRLAEVEIFKDEEEKEEECTTTSKE